MSLSWRRREISHSQLRADSRKLEWQYAVNRNQNLTIQRPLYLPDLSLNLAPPLEVDLGAESLHNCGFFQRALLLPQNSESRETASQRASFGPLQKAVPGPAASLTSSTDLTNFEVVVSAE